MSNLFGMLAVIIAAGLLAGCGDTPKGDVKTASKSADPHAGHSHGGHSHAGHQHGDHPSKGPHGGDLIELGDEEYHAELLHDDATNTVTIYLLDGHAKVAAAIAEKEIFVNIKRGDKADQFPLAAKPQGDDGDGKSSRFVSSEKEFATALDAPGASAQLVLTIEGRQFRGKIASHGHDHSHDDPKPATPK